MVYMYQRSSVTRRSFVGFRAFLRNFLLIVLNLSACLCFSGCVSDNKESPAESNVLNSLMGEWTIDFNARFLSDNNLEKRNVVASEGRIVFDSAIDCYCNEVFQPPAGAVFGRAYLDRGLVGGGLYGSGQFADWKEEVMAVLGSKNEINISISPLIGGPSLVGVFEGDTISGRWVLVRGEVRDSGTFIMWRAPRTEATDSAVIRSQREQRRWRDSGFVIPEAPEDTLRTPVPEL